MPTPQERFKEGGLLTSEGGEFFVPSKAMDKLATFAEHQNEALYNAIMADLGDSILADFGDSNDYEQSERASFEARKVEQVLRQHLGLPIHH